MIHRQVREKVGNCRSPILMRDYVDSCTGNLALGTLDEDYRTYCQGWLPLISENCTRMAEYEFRYLPCTSRFCCTWLLNYCIIFSAGPKLRERLTRTTVTSEDTAVEVMNSR